MILLLETSHKLCSLAVCNLQGTILWEHTDENVFKHAEVLPAAVNNALTYAGTNLKAVAISAGPGSYTGLRIGTALATGFCFAKNLPFIAIPTLHALANSLITTKTKLALLHAINTEFYSCLIQNNIPQTTQLITIPQIEELANNNVEIITDNNLKLSHLNVNTLIPSANLLAALAVKAFVNKAFTPLETFKPLYFKDFLPGVSKKFTV